MSDPADNNYDTSVSPINSNSMTSPTSTPIINQTLTANGSSSNLNNTTTPATINSQNSGGQQQQQQPPTGQIADINAFTKYLKQFVPVLLDSNAQSTIEFEKCLTEKHNLDSIRKFLGESQVRTLIIQKYLTKDEEESEPTDEPNQPTALYLISTEVHYTNPKCISVQLIKRGAIVENDKKFHTQIRIISLADSSPYETLHSYVSNTLAPYFKSYIKRGDSNSIQADGQVASNDTGVVSGVTNSASSGANDQFASIMEKRIAEVEMGFLHLQQNIEIPEINITVHPTVLQMIKKAVDENRKPKVDDFSNLVEDTDFLNQLQSGVSRWIREIKKVTKLDRDPSTGTALQEITFWLNLERALNKITEKRESTEVTLTLDILRYGKRFIATVSFDSDTGLKEALDTAKDYNLLMKDFPLNELISATELNKISVAIQSIFNHLKKIRNSKYPLNRTLKLIEAISKDLTTQLLKVLSTQRLMVVSFDDFEKTMKSCFSVFTAWDDEYEKLQAILRDLAKRKRDEFKMVWRINPSHKRLQNRLVVMQNFRRQHEQLRLVISRVLRPAVSINNTNDQTSENGQIVDPALNNQQTKDASLDVADANAIEEVSLAYERVKEVDALDITEEGQELWESAIRRYDERIERVEARMTARLRDQLGTAKNANEMFRIFSRFNALFVRPHIRGAIREYQTQLIQRVKDDIEALQEKFKKQYIQSKCYRMSKIRDIPPVAGSIIWSKQIERQLNMYMGRVEAVLGKGWETHVDGQKLKADGDSFRMKLNTQELFEDWSRKVNQKNLQNSGRIFLIDTTRASKGTNYTLKVNFSPEIITLTKEARNMKWLVSRVPLAIVNKAHTARQMYPYAISLIENVSTYKRICDRVNEKKTCQLLVAGMKKDIQNLILDMSNLVWDSYKLESSVQKFSDSIYNFREKVDELITVETNIDQQLKELDICAYDETKFAEILYEIQKSIDYLNLKGFSNLQQWVNKLDEEVEKKFAQRLTIAIKVWIDVLLDKKSKQDDDSVIIRRPNQQSNSNKDDILSSFSLNFDDNLSGITLISGQSDSSDVNNASSANNLLLKIGGQPKIKPIILEILIRNQLLYVLPSIEDAREHLISQLYDFSSIVTTQKRIQHSRYQVTMEAESEYKVTYKNLLNKFQNGIRLLEYGFSAIDRLLNQAQDYIKIWLHFQSLWDLQPDNLYLKLGININSWINCLNEMKDSRKSFDTQETQRLFGPITIDYTKVQSKVNVKYDAWHKEVLSKFGSLLGNELQEFHTNVSKSRSDLESQSVEASSTSDAVGVITYVQTLKRKLKDWERRVDLYTNAQKILERQRYQFPSNWLYTDYIQGEWGAFNEILKRKDHSIQNQIASLQSKILSEEKVIENKTQELIHDWDSNKPTNGQLKPDQALKNLQVFETKFNRIKEERDNMMKAKDALELRDNLSNSNDMRITVSIEELQDLKGVWSEISKIWSQIEEQKEKQWLTVQPRKLRTTLDGLLNQMKEMPVRLRQYDSYNYVKNLLQNYLKMNLLIVDLKSEALKERHWKQLMKKMNVVWNLNDLTLGQVWDINLTIYEGIIKDMMLIAQGEKALEEFLKQVSELWKNYTLELINYQNKCQIIRGWDDLFNKLKEHINSVSAMKLSPYYKEFEEEALSWEDKLNRINSVFDVWIDVQRRWVYLDGIFGGSADIKHLLPNETQKFQNVSSEFLTLMRKVSKSPLVLDILNIQGIQKTLERLAELLAKIQKALGEYLERERSSFPRFYFVGDEDLLEIIGNSKNVPRLQKHFKKMFAGVYSILLNEDNTIVNGVVSKEGEEVIFKTPVSIASNPKINDWLTLVEKEIRLTLAFSLMQSVQECNQFKTSLDRAQYLSWAEKYQGQLIVLSAQISWSESVESALKQLESNPSLADSADTNPLESVLKHVENTLKLLADSVLQDQQPIRRRKLEHLIIEHVHQRDVIRNLLSKKIASTKHFEWLSQMRFYFDPKVTNTLKQLTIQMANSKFHYGFEYLGVQDKLVQTPLTDRCYLTMTQALEARLGGSPFGPAGTGKTESVKALGHQLGRFVVVFNCDETFDFHAMGRIFVGLCQVGAWGCFDEFNRLEERMLSAVSQQIQTIQEALKEQLANQQNESKQKQNENITIELVGKQVNVNPHMAIFITMNPGYAGRSNLPDNLKKLFRSLAMTQPDNVLIAQVMLYSQGFRTAEKLAHKVVPFFKLCNEQLSSQSHYDFGLRSLKSVLVMAGNVKREKIQRIREELHKQNQQIDESKIAADLNEQEILIQSIMESFVPRLITEDLPLLQSLLNDVFPGVKYEPIEIARLKDEIKKVCEELHFVYGNSSSSDQSNNGSLWLEKVLQLYSISNLNHGLMMVGPSGSGKSSAWRVLLKALERYEGIEGVAHIIDPKAISKDALYGSMDPNTREWTDGLFTHILRKIIDNVRGEMNKRQWIIFDGDVDPEWVENLNSVLDDNKLLTLPNGERLNIPPNVRIMFEVQDLKYATLATVSRCGMIWFSEHVLTLDMIYENYFLKLNNVPLEGGDDEDTMVSVISSDKVKQRSGSVSGELVDSNNVKQPEISSSLADQRLMANYMKQFFQIDGLVTKCLEQAVKYEHIMDFTRLRALGSMFTMLNQSIRNVLIYNLQHDFRLSEDVMEKYISKSLILAVLWSFSGDCKLKFRCELGEFIRSSTTLPMPNSTSPIIDYEVQLTTGEWTSWLAKVPQIEVETHKVAAPDVVVPTIDTIRHESLLYTWLNEHKPLLLCGPPGSGKTMTLFAALRSLPDLEVVGLNFSSATNPELMLKTFDHYCEYRRTPNGIVLSPIQMGKWLVIFCDEINLPDEDKYGTQRIISFIRQCIEHGGFYRSSDQSWVKLERIQFVGACNPPTDPGRKPLSHRFLRHVPLVYVDYPGELSLKQIYGTFNRAMLRIIPSLRAYAEPLTNAMVEFYLMSQERFTVDQQPHYIYSPREMTRWVRGICEAIRPLESLAVEGLVRLFVHEALRLFQDRLVTNEEREWTDENVNMVAKKHFANMDSEKALKRPILYSNWLKKDYLPVDQEELREYVKARLKVFYEEELDVPLVLFNEVLDHVLRIDRIFRQPQGHLLLIGVSGAGKTTLSRFVAWINGLSVFQIKVHNNYSSEDFDDDLRNVLRRSGTKGEKIVFILDESNVLDSGFLERMNTLLANGEVPGLFEGDEYSTLMTQCKEGAQRDGLMLDSSEELYKWFTNEVMRNLHVVFTMNPSQDGLKNRASTSPALFNRCVLNWFGDWSHHAFYQVGKEFTLKIDLEKSDYMMPDNFKISNDFDLELSPSSMTHRDAVVCTFVQIHDTLHQANNKLQKKGTHTTTITPRHYLDFINHFAKLYNEKRSELEDQQVHLNIGLSKIKETVDQVEELQKSLAVKRTELEKKNNEANLKLKQMMLDQQEAEKKKVVSQDLQQTLNEQLEEIAKKKSTVMEDLSKVEPAVAEAQNAVKSIKKQHLVELRAMVNPPAAVKLGLESICLILNQETSDWKVIRSIIVRENFISTIINFQTDNITTSIKNKMKERFLNNPDYDFAKVNNASQACGPLVKWATAQIQYADMLHKVEPLREELKSLEDAAKQNELKAQDLDNIINQLEKSISQYKLEYAELISQAQIIKSDLNSVESKVERSVALLKSLSNEQTRWESSSESFKVQMSTIVGDVLLSSALMAYGGYYDQAMRNNLFNTWMSSLHTANIKFKEDLARIEYLSNADERMSWHASSLPTDDLCIENAIMLKRFNRYPLIIDPSGQATEFILNMYKDRKITKTSFLDNSFRKNLESALRFGNPILIQDVENYDPILNPVLNREIRRTGGRVLITLGDQDIDFSPTFTMFLSTRDPTVEFPPDICSRVTFVNFTVTRASLQAQCLHQVLKCERPDVEEKRIDLLKIQGEFQQRLRHLEKDLLGALNESKGKILNDDSIITRLETLKKEASEISRKVAETDQVMKEVDRVINQYLALSQACSSIYFTMDILNQIHSLYQYSLTYFLEIFNTVLTSNKNLANVKDSQQRLKIISKDLFYLAYYRLARGMLHEDRIVLALLFSKLYLKGFASSNQNELNKVENSFRSLMSSFNTGLNKDEIASQSTTSSKRKVLSAEQNEALRHLMKLSEFSSLRTDIDSNQEDFFRWLELSNPESNIPPNLFNLNISSEPSSTQNNDLNLAEINTSMKHLLLVKAFRPDRFISMGELFVNKIFGDEFIQQAEKMLDLATIVENEIKPTTPILMCSVAGFDASGYVEDLANDLDKPLTSIAIGSSEGFTQAEKAINNSSKSGRWVLLKNVHLAPQWLVQLEKKLHNLQAHSSFRIFLSMEITPKIPSNLLRLGRCLVFEPPPGIRANLLRTLSVIPANRMNKAPAERSRLYFLLAWLHAITQERLRYVPLGWSKTYEFNESDLKCGLDTIDVWIDQVAMGRTNLPPNKVPFNAIYTLLSDCVYGGKIDNQFDLRLLNTFLRNIFSITSFENDFKLVSDDSTSFHLTMPDATKREHFYEWIDSLKHQQTPSWLGLPNSAETVLLTNYCNEIVNKLLKLSILDEEEEEMAYDDNAETKKKRTSESEGDGRPAWMRQLNQSVLEWLKILPKQLNGIKRTQENIKDPLFRFFEREINTGIRLLKTVLHDLNDVVSICQGHKKQTNYHRQLLKDLAKGLIPQNWKRYTVPKNLIVQPWIVDFAERIKQMSQITKNFSEQGLDSLKSSIIWLGGLFSPEAYITATRQYVAQTNSWSLEELILEINVQSDPNNANLDNFSFGLTGLKLQGAECNNNRLFLSAKISNEFPLAVIRWARQSTSEKQSSITKINLPVYLNSTRSELLFRLDMETEQNDSLFYMRGVAILASNVA